jgi:hypothetical protein
LAKKQYVPGQVIAWSPSRVNTYQKCPKMFFEEAVLGTVPFVQSEQQLYGDRVHKMLDKRIKGEAELPVEEKHLEPLVQSIINAPGQTFAEQKMTINTSLKPTGWFSDDAYCRLVIDVMKINGTVGFMGDWKTGKPNFDQYQLKLNAALGFVFYPSLERITTAYIWLRTKTLDPAKYTRADLPRMWQELLQVPTQIQESSRNNHWPVKPGKHCGWCGVNKQGRCPSAAEKYRGA